MIQAIARVFRPDPPAPVAITDKEEIRMQMRFWQNRILISSMIGYALFYFVRKNLSLAMPAMGKDLGITKADLGLFLTLHGVIYGLSKFANGFLGDRANARIFMVTGLALSALMNIFFGLSSMVIALGVFWMLNGWVQGMGFPPCARLMTHWFSPKVLATKMAFWNTSHSIGAALVAILCGYLVVIGWRYCFFVPAGIALAGCVYLLFALRDTPESLGLPEPEGTASIASRNSSASSPAAPPGACGSDDAPAIPFGRFLMEQVFTNPFIWIIAIANFFVYTVRYAVLDWGPTLLHEAKGFALNKTGWMVAAFEISGIIGMLVSGWVTDKVFGGRGARTCVCYMLLCTGAVFLFWRLPSTSMLLNTSLLCIAGFFIYGPQCLVGIIVANLATKKAAATAVGLTGIFGYLSTVLSGWGLGKLVDKAGWDAAFLALIFFAGVGTLLFALAWPARAHGYCTDEESEETATAF
jgi:sugar phosphate permease